jgi:hypothetical protein
VCLPSFHSDQFVGFLRGVPHILRDPYVYVVICGVWTLACVFYIALYSLIYVGGVTYRFASPSYFALFASRWLYAVLFVLFLFVIFAELLRKAPKRRKLREEFETES